MSRHHLFHPILPNQGTILLRCVGDNATAAMLFKNGYCVYECDLETADRTAQAAPFAGFDMGFPAIHTDGIVNQLTVRLEYTGEDQPHIVNVNIDGPGKSPSDMDYILVNVE